MVLEKPLNDSAAFVAVDVAVVAVVVDRIKEQHKALVVVVGHQSYQNPSLLMVPLLVAIFWLKKIRFLLVAVVVVVHFILFEIEDFSTGAEAVAVVALIEQYHKKKRSFHRYRQV